MIYRSTMHYLAAGLLIVGLQCAHTLWSQEPGRVTVKEEPLHIPTYNIGVPEKAPIFYSGRAYQGAQGQIYPYPFQDMIGDVRATKTYQAIYLENKFIKICILPELGGRIYMAQDKTDNYDFIYHQHVIKPAMIGMTGAWISGGIEWDIPHHHRASSYMKVDHRIQSNPDGSVTVWVGETELRDRIKWMVGITLFPDKSYVETTVRVVNQTPVANSMLYFANAAVAASSSYQVIFPPSTQYATTHAKNQFRSWPISDREFGDEVFAAPRNVSWWKNHDSAASWFAWNASEDFFGGYDHAKDAGMIHVADHHVVPGKKFFTWGTSEDGRMWDKVLTDTDGPYLELMAGGYSDNQPDYSWIEPFEARSFKEYWYPVRQMGGFKNANQEAAVNLEANSEREVRLAFNTTAPHHGATVVLRTGDRELLSRHIDIAPDKPFSELLKIPAGLKETDLTAILRSAEGVELIAYRPLLYAKKPVAESVKAPVAPKDMKTIEELYLTGLRLVQFHSAARDPYPYFQEALRRDPGDYRTNTQLGILFYKRWMYAEAEAHLEAAVARTTKDYTRPKDGEASYYLGLTSRAQGKLDAAYDAFYRSTWSDAWTGAGYYQLAVVDSLRGDRAKALEHLTRSLARNTENISALHLQSSLLRRNGETKGAGEAARKAGGIDVLDTYAENELVLLRSSNPDGGSAPSRTDHNRWKGSEQDTFEAAVQYGNVGLWQEAIQLLSQMQGNALADYFLGSYQEKAGDARAAAHSYQLAASLPPDYVFPFREESLPILTHVLEINPQDARGWYYLGTLLYDKQPERAMVAWERSAALAPHFAMVHRNLGLGYLRTQNNPRKGVAALEIALSLEENNGLFLSELDDAYEAAGTPVVKRLENLEKHHRLVLTRDDTAEKYVNLSIHSGAYDQAIELLSTRHFHVIEGSYSIHESYINALVLRGQHLLKAGKYHDALVDFERAQQYPDNLEVGRPRKSDHETEIAYWIGTAQGTLGETALANSNYERVVANPCGDAMSCYLRGLALRKLTRESEAEVVFARLIDGGTKRLAKSAEPDFFAKFGEGRTAHDEAAEAHYSIALGRVGKGDTNGARTEFVQALEQAPNDLGAQTGLASLGD